MPGRACAPDDLRTSQAVQRHRSASGEFRRSPSEAPVCKILCWTAPTGIRAHLDPALKGRACGVREGQRADREASAGF